uniref:Uncharacterized protein n=1 Tax=viral metagenome TaxID=1070528 RepID=A0A6C0BP20_9ZZZZ
MYGNCNARVACATKSSLNEESTGQSAYRMAVQAVMRPGAVAVGTGPGPGVTPSYYGALRKRIGGYGGVGDPVLAQRSWFSSGCPPTRFNDIEDTQKKPIVWVNRCGAAINKGAGMQAVHTRNQLVNYASVNEQDISGMTHMIGDQWSNGYHGLSSFGGNINTRLNEACAVQMRYANAACSPISRTSYGSYGM